MHAGHSEFDPAQYGAVFSELLRVDRRRALDAGSPNLAARPALERLSPARAFDGTPITDAAMAACCVAAVWLLHDLLEGSHALSQSIGSAEGSFWHGVMHRREGDYANSKYWFRRAGAHPVHAQLAARFGDWDPCGFVDQCAQALRSGDGRAACLDRQQREWEAMFDYCYRGAVDAAA